MNIPEIVDTIHGWLEATVATCDFVLACGYRDLARCVIDVANDRPRAEAVEAFEQLSVNLRTVADLLAAAVRECKAKEPTNDH